MAASPATTLATGTTTISSSRFDQQIKFDFVDFYLSGQRKLKELYLNNFKSGLGFASFKESLNELQVNSKKLGSHIKVKYAITCRHNQDVLTFACRGTTFQEEPDDKSVTTMFSVNKFPNEHEFMEFYGCNLMQFMQALETQGFTFAIMPKIDGSFCHIWADKQGVIHAFTLGSLDPSIKMQNALSDSPTWSEQIKKLMTEEMKSFVLSHPNHQLVCELVTPFNHILTTYSNNLTTLVPILDIGLDGLPRHSHTIGSSFRPEYLIPKFTCPKSKEEFEELYNKCFHMMDQDVDKYGLLPEGFCIYAMKESESDESDDNNDFKNDSKCNKSNLAFPICKVKSPSYMKQHDLDGVALNIGGERDLCKMQELYCEGKMDDIVENVRRNHIFNEFEPFLHSLFSSVKELKKELTNYVKVKNYKAYYSCVNKHFPLWFARIMLKYRSMDISVFNEMMENPMPNFLTAILTDLKILQKGGKCSHWFIPESISKQAQTEKKKSVESSSKSGLELKSDSKLESKDSDHDRDIHLNWSSVVLCDYDGSLIHFTSGQNFDTVDQDNVKENKYVVKMLQTYHLANYPIIILTGRSATLKEEIAKVFETKVGFAPDIIHCNSNRDVITTPKFKSSIVELYMSNPGVKNIYHIDDHELILRNGLSSNDKDKTKVKKIRYIPIWIDPETGKCRPLPNSSKRALLVTLVGPPGCGKTSILENICTLLNNRLPSMKERKCLIIGFDKIKIDYPEDLTDEIRYRRFQGLLHQAIVDKAIVLIDACNNTASTIKDMLEKEKKNNCDILIGTFMPIPLPTTPTTTMMTKQKENKTIPNSYIEQCSKYAWDRIYTGKMNGSSLTDIKSLDEMKKLITVKVRECTAQVMNPHRKVIRYTHDHNHDQDDQGSGTGTGGIYTNLDDMTNRLVQEINQKLKRQEELETSFDNSFGMYLGIPLSKDWLSSQIQDDESSQSESKTKTEMKIVQCPHVTLIPPNLPKELLSAYSLCGDLSIILYPRRGSSYSNEFVCAHQINVDFLPGFHGESDKYKKLFEKQLPYAHITVALADKVPAVAGLNLVKLECAKNITFSQDTDISAEYLSNSLVYTMVPL